MSDGQFWFLLSSLNTVLAAKHLMDFDAGPWFRDVIFVVATAVALRAAQLLLMGLTIVLARELQTDKEDLQARIVRQCGEFSEHLLQIFYKPWGRDRERQRARQCHESRLCMRASQAWQGVLTIGFKIAGWGVELAMPRARSRLSLHEPEQPWTH